MSLRLERLKIYGQCHDGFTVFFFFKWMEIHVSTIEKN